MKSILFSILITLSFNNTICDGGLRTNQIVFSEKSSFNASDNTVTHIVSLENDSDQVYYSWLSPLNSSVIKRQMYYFFCHPIGDFNLLTALIDGYTMFDKKPGESLIFRLNPGEIISYTFVNQADAKPEILYICSCSEDDIESEFGTVLKEYPFENLNSSFTDIDAFIR